MLQKKYKERTLGAVRKKEDTKTQSGQKETNAKPKQTKLNQNWNEGNRIEVEEARTSLLIIIS